MITREEVVDVLRGIRPDAASYGGRQMPADVEKAMVAERERRQQADCGAPTPGSPMQEIQAKLVALLDLQRQAEAELHGVLTALVGGDPSVPVPSGPAAQPPAGALNLLGMAVERACANALRIAGQVERLRGALA